MLLAGREIVPGTGHEQGLLLLEALYAKYTDGPMPPILRTAQGKPYFETGYPHFSITHTRHHVFCALSEKPIGIDAEELNRRVPLGLAGKILSPGEMTQYLASPDPSRALLTFWVLKEAEAKCTGSGLRIYPNHTNFSLKDPRVQYRDGCLLAVIEEE